jgi:hypothetical protein
MRHLVVMHALAGIAGSPELSWSGLPVRVTHLAPVATFIRDDSLPLAVSVEEGNGTAPVAMALYGGGEMAKFSTFGFFGALPRGTRWDLMVFTSGSQLAATSVLHGSMERLLAEDMRFRQLLRQHATDVLRNFEAHEAAPSSAGCHGFYRIGRKAFGMAKRLFSHRVRIPGVHLLLQWLGRTYLAHLANELDADPVCVSHAFLSGAQSSGNFMFNVTKFAQVVLPGVRTGEVLARAFRGADVHYAFKVYAHWRDERLRVVRSERAVEQTVSGSAYGHFHGDRAFLMNPPDALMTDGNRILVDRFSTRALSAMDAVVHGISCFSFVPLVLAQNIPQRMLTDGMQKSEQVQVNRDTTVTVPLVDTGTLNAEGAEEMRAQRESWAGTLGVVQALALAVLIEAALRRGRSSDGESVHGAQSSSSARAHAVLAAAAHRTRPATGMPARSVEHARRRRAAVAAMVLAAATATSWFAQRSGHTDMTEGDCSTLLLSIGLLAEKHPSLQPHTGVVVGVSQYGSHGADGLLQANLLAEEWTALRESGDVKLQIVRTLAEIPDFAIPPNLRICIVWAYPRCDSSPLKLQAFSTDDYRTKVASYIACARRTRRIWRIVHRAEYFEECQRALRARPR